LTSLDSSPNGQVPVRSVFGIITLSFYGKIEVLDLSDHVFTCKGARLVMRLRPTRRRSSSDPLVGDLEPLARAH